jgi:hypothetical protein
MAEKVAHFKEKKEGVLEYKWNLNAPPISSKRRKRKER